ncbi:DUF6415 family natural product biosynthesis protein [Streptomyces sp. NPDC012617]|uniref:DUF6415 family natural product biosynthesis protein n=1 Tax=Streptomyces TaxID=1883 RepID=UPI0033E8FCC5
MSEIEAAGHPRDDEAADVARPRMTVHTRGETDAAVASWLLCAADERTVARKEWDEQGLALLRCGSLFAAIRLPGELVRAAAGSDTPTEVDAYLARVLPSGGAVIADGHAARYYALVPASTGRWWHVPGTVCLGAGTYLGVPRPGVESSDPVYSYWSVPMSSAGALCSPTEVQAVLRLGRERLGAEQREVAARQRVPLDIQTMRSVAERACDVEGLDDEGLEQLLARLRAYAEVLVPEVRYLAGRWPADYLPATVAFVGAEEGERRLGPRASGGSRSRAVRKTAMSVMALCGHYENVAQPSVY